MMEVCEDSRFFFGQAELWLAPLLDFKNYRKRKFSSHKSSAYRFRPFTQLAMSASLLPRLNRWPSSQVPASANSASSSPLWPMPEETGRAERNDRFAGEVIDGNKAAHGPCGDAPPDGVADEHGVVIVPAVHIGAFQSHSTKALVVVFTGNAAVIVRPVQIIGGVGVRRNDFKQVSTHGVGDGLRYALCSAGGGEIHHQRFARSRYRAGSFPKKQPRWMRQCIRREPQKNCSHC